MGEQTQSDDIRRQDIVLKVSCGSCIFHKRIAAYEAPCEQLGVANSAKTCRHYTVDPRLVGTPEQLRAIGALAEISDNTLLPAIFVRAHRLKRTGLSIGQKVYLRILGLDYLNNYASAIVLGCDRDGNLILGGHANFTSLVSPTSVLTVEQFIKKRASLVKAGKITDPKGLTRITERNTDKLLLLEPALLGPARKHNIPQKKRGRGRPPGSKNKKSGPITLSAGSRKR